MKRARSAVADENAGTPVRSIYSKRLRSGIEGLKLLDSNILANSETPCVPKHIGKLADTGTVNRKVVESVKQRATTRSLRLRASGIQPSATPASGRSSNVFLADHDTVSKRKAPSVPPSKLTSKRSRLAVPPGHVKPSEPVSRRAPPSDLYSEQWLYDQERYFMRWMNHAFYSAGVTRHAANGATAHSSSVHFATGKVYDYMRRKATTFYQSSALQTALQKVNMAVDENKLAVCTTSDFTRDAGLRKRLVATLMSYDARWLTLALDVLSPASTPPSSLVNSTTALASLMDEEF
ncbi:hypothetical protein THASP1DRAFT_33533 [Thamnocephalis sphaerospora]|uniref:Uncharacterized protein n=1 Tax=Thamnocephalis sphaerospora TaxID=78915 RepID=A0A4V1IVN4_9FUNG|nr:hypothetical protein THASP1DRAFT_33533 [Thamnocephalis sphaerospora]|eukprot:RKP04669.1 hypothetical protein THASP1DRAFT_33533 [Thamnocephalis sphaerospora]